jgi:hypothetical protein
MLSRPKDSLDFQVFADMNLQNKRKVFRCRNIRIKYSCPEPDKSCEHHPRQPLFFPFENIRVQPFPLFFVPFNTSLGF